MIPSEADPLSLAENKGYKTQRDQTFHKDGADGEKSPASGGGPGFTVAQPTDMRWGRAGPLETSWRWGSMSPLTSSNPNAQGAGIFHHEPAQAPRLELREAIRDPQELKVSCTPHQPQVPVAPTSLLLPNYP